MKRLILIFALILSLWSCSGQVPGIGGMMPTISQTEEVIDIKYGYIYNGYSFDYSITGTYLSSDGWRIPTIADFNTLATYLGGTAVAGSDLKDTSLEYWLSPNTSATNSAAFNGRGSGARRSGSFSLLKSYCYLVASDMFSANKIPRLSYSNDDLGILSYYGTEKDGHAVRLIANSTILSDGDEGIYIGNDGKVYRTICIGGQEWLADNLAETKYRNGTIIPVVEGNTEWNTLSTDARCAYNNDELNVFE